MASKDVLNLASGSNSTPNHTPKALNGGKVGTVGTTTNSNVDHQISSVARKGSKDLKSTGGSTGTHRLKG